MAENVSITAGAGTVISTDEVTVNSVLVHVQRTKVGFGVDGSYVDVSASNPLPVTGPLTDAQLRAAPVPVSGTFWQATQPISAASLPLPTGAATEATLDAIGVLLAGGIGVSGPLTDAQLRASAVSVADGGSSLTVDTGQLPAALIGGRLDVVVGASLPAGTNNIGDVDVLTQPARAATTDTITAKLATDRLQDGTTALVPKFAAIQVSASGNIVAAVTGKKIRVLKLTLSASAAVNVKFVSGGGSPTDLTGLHYLAANGGMGISFCPLGNFETAAGEPLAINLSAAVAVGGSLVYVEVD